ncbi:hypothetical protein PIB30_065568 [Stylosanthes scabra]|uniref:Uncharacterized protein n=1 Tax=Stylosanthes scabra TaxID=79078 RepID=A0ABU6SM51_9FABA|nr:hypothetical protein [Stylosanthes scabra]
MRISLRYVGHGIFFFSLFDKDNTELELVPDDESYVPAILPNSHLEYIENEFHLKYIPPISPGSEFEPIEMSSDSNPSEVSKFSDADDDSGSEESADSGFSICQAILQEIFAALEVVQIGQFVVW